jgi:predicted small metal-binding protein
VKFLPSFKCKDIGLECPFEATADTQDELMKKISAHAASVHNMKTVSPEMMEKIKKAIKE